tara:strand:- start:213 stop:428 length:216 start_codon:yes stop_codon:yes gene_type:complete
MEELQQMGFIPYMPKGMEFNPKSIDYPMSYNSGEQLDQLSDYLQMNSETLGVKNVQWKTPNHYNHLHVDFY